ncbi:hypothetical protein EKO04_003604 [Ascochyta lentis]|uniref:Uncharacterized protein n=1 Tax=Ascochyta lentis TaxID=205686 RepID=A0A8H7J7M0_9PLEO|nr:hypothetical protein EKO04_003604 [Ascochyta lentis]
MQFFGLLTALFLASAAAACPDGPYKTNSACGGNCFNVQRCGDNNGIIRCENGFWREIRKCGHCRFGSCV